jgi:hypothetical protein
VELADTGFHDLEPVELGVLGEERRAQPGNQTTGIAAGPHEPVGDRTGPVDLALHVPALLEVAKVARVGRGEGGGGDVEEPVEMDT